MRVPFVETLSGLADRDRRIFLLTADVGFSVLDRFRARHPDRFLNVGVAEQDLVGVATGLAEGGYLPFVYSIATFATLRPFEMLRNGPAHHGFPVRVVGVGPGLDYGAAGFTHHALEDVAVLRCLRGFRVMVPADDDDARDALLETWDAPGPVYYRLGKSSETPIAAPAGAPGRPSARLAAPGEQVLLVAMGRATAVAWAARERLLARGVSAALAVVREIVEGGVPGLVDLLRGRARVVSVEDHAVIGGLGTIVAETLAEAGIGARLVRVGLRPRGAAWAPGDGEGDLTPEAVCRAAEAGVAPGDPATPRRACAPDARRAPTRPAPTARGSPRT